ncbi:TPA: AlpA family phage regulatory protein [Escherichia coli]|nr:AlpA family phage regulatory protein [Escherichia coli]HDT0179997.1 AlpA family phage regulatory protein [Escherichia coli]
MSINLEKIHARLISELKRVGPLAVSKSTGISRATIYNWMEKGNIPLDKLVVLGVAGVDVAFILTGMSTDGEVEIQNRISPEKQKLIDTFDNMTPDQQRSFLEIGRFYTQPKPGKIAG